MDHDRMSVQSLAALSGDDTKIRSEYALSRRSDRRDGPGGAARRVRPTVESLTTATAHPPAVLRSPSLS